MSFEIAKNAPVELQRIRDASGGDSGFEQNVIRVFLRDTTNRLTILQRALSSGDTRQIYEESHSLKSATGSIGAQKMFLLCGEIERCADTGDSTQLSALVPSLEDEFGLVSAYLHKHLDSFTHNKPA